MLRPEKPHYPEAFDPAWWDTYWKAPPYGYSLPKRQASYEVVKVLVPPRSSVFDYACGYATISRQLKAERGCRIAGCDISAGIIRQIGEPGFYVGEEIRGHYDYLILSHFLEHISNPAQVVEYCKQFADNVIILIPENFRRVKEHQAMQWGSLAEFEALIPGVERVGADYPADLQQAFKVPIYIIRNRKPTFTPEVGTIYNKRWWNDFYRKPVSKTKLAYRYPYYDVVTSLIPPGASVFDYACGLAIIPLKLEREKGCIIAGCDFSEVMIRKINRPTFYAGAEIKGYYDYVILSQFLEHVTNPLELVEHCQNHADTVLITVPNVSGTTPHHDLCAWRDLAELERMLPKAKRVHVSYPSQVKALHRYPIYTITQKSERVLCSITSKAYTAYSEQFVRSVREAGWTGKVIMFTPDDLTLDADCVVKKVPQSIRSDLFNDPRWLKADLLKYFADGDVVTYMDSDMLVRPGFERVFDYEFASAWTEYDNVGDIEAAERYVGYKLPPGRHFDAVVTARVCQETRRFFDVWKVVMPQSIMLRHGTVCAFNIAIALVNPDIQKLPQKYHFYTLDPSWPSGGVGDECIIHYAGLLGKKEYDETMRGFPMAKNERKL